MIQVIHHMCQPWLYKKSQCRRCIEACPVEDCIRFEGDTVSVDDEKCVSCGICTNVCPTSALVFDDLSDGELWNRLNDHAAEENILFGCTLRPDESPVSGAVEPGQSTHLNLPCLAILKEAHLASLILSGIQKISLDLTGCAGCSLSTGKNAIEASLSHARAILERTGHTERIEPIIEAPLKEGKKGKKKRKKRVKAKEIVPSAEYSRRELFGFLKDKAEEKATEKVFGPKTDEAEEVEPEKEMPERRALLVDALKKMDPMPPHAARLIEGTFPVHNVGITDKCTMCGRCDVFCPTGALGFAEGEEEVAIEFRTERCVGCHECRELCPDGAIYYETDIEVERLVDDGVRQLIKRQRLKCPKCRKMFFPEFHPDGCPTCKKLNNMDNRIGRILFGQTWDGEKTRFGKEIT